VPDSFIFPAFFSLFPTFSIYKLKILQSYPFLGGLANFTSGGRGLATPPSLPVPPRIAPPPSHSIALPDIQANTKQTLPDYHTILKFWAPQQLCPRPALNLKLSSVILFDIVRRLCLRVE
jgi:hypothetical protein